MEYTHQVIFIGNLLWYLEGSQSSLNWCQITQVPFEMQQLACHY